MTNHHAFNHLSRPLLASLRALSAAVFLLAISVQAGSTTRTPQVALQTTMTHAARPAPLKGRGQGNLTSKKTPSAPYPKGTGIPTVRKEETKLAELPLDVNFNVSVHVRLGLRGLTAMNMTTIYAWLASWMPLLFGWFIRR